MSNLLKCFHKFVDGFGGMGDGLVCVKCGLAMYAPVFYEEFMRSIGRVIKNDGTFGHQEIFKFEVPITWKSDWKAWSYYFDNKGVLCGRGGSFHCSDNKI